MTTNSRLELPPVYAIINLDDRKDYLEYAEKLFQSGISLLQLRSKILNDEDFSKRVKDILQIAKEFSEKKTLIVNDNLLVCLSTGADGIHLGQEDVSVEEAREELGENKIIGLSTHNLEQLSAGERKQVDYLALGPIFLSKTKQGHAPEVGVKILNQAASSCSKPLVAIGGINKNNAVEVFKTGVDCVALISELEESKDLTETHSELANAKSLASEL